MKDAARKTRKSLHLWNAWVLVEQGTLKAAYICADHNASPPVNVVCGALWTPVQIIEIKLGSKPGCDS